MTEDLIRRLIAAGLSKQQASSVTAETLVNLFMPDDGKMLIREAKGQVDEMRQLVNNLRKEYAELKRKIEGLSDTLLAISEAQKEHGVITDEKARNVVALYAALLTMGEKAGADAEDAVRNAGYVVYAYLGGQARRDITYIFPVGFLCGTEFFDSSEIPMGIACDVDQYNSSLCHSDASTG